MHLCEYCNYLTGSNYDFRKHCATTKHNKTKESCISNKNIIDDDVNNNTNVNDKDTFKCEYCNKETGYKYNLNRHMKICKFKVINDKILQNQISETTNIQNGNKIINQNASTINNINNTINNNITNISKIQNLNINFCDVIDINTFIENYKNEYGLTNKQTETLLDNYKNGGINSCINSLVYYLKESAIQQYKEIKGKEIAMSDIILPFILSDKCIRDHFEKNESGWDKTIMIDNIRKIVGITDDHVYKHHNTYLQLNDQHKRKLINGVLKSSDYSKLNLLSKPNLYKITEANNKLKQIDIQSLLQLEEEEMSLL